MASPAPLATVQRGDIIESIHVGHAVICDEKGQIVEAWGDPDRVILPRSSCKMIQALPLMESGAGRDLSDAHLAMACASHEGEPRHVDFVLRWLNDIGLTEEALLCGPEESRVTDYRDEMIRERKAPGRALNNCSGKHTGFLLLSQHLKAGPTYIGTDHPVQRAVKSAFEEVTEAPSPSFGIDGCSAPNFATSLHGLARAMAAFASATESASIRQSAMVRLHQAMMAHPGLVSGRIASCNDLMAAAPGKVAVKTGAEGVYVAIVPEQKIGIAVKADDGAKRAATAAIAALLVRRGIASADNPKISAWLEQPVPNRDGLLTGHVRAAADLMA